MASLTMHLAAAHQIADRAAIRDHDRFFLGTLLPDACDRAANGHLKYHSPDGSFTTYRLSEFRDLYRSRLLSDSLYLGYYLHLIQDLVYRHFLYDDHHWNPRIPGNVDKLHRDYMLLNPYIIRSYHLGQPPVIPETISSEPLYERFPFHTDQLEQELSREFSEDPQGDAFLMTASLADAYISRAVETCIQEIAVLRNGQTGIDEIAWAWRR